jgi:predicted Zn-dependent peptidase
MDETLREIEAVEAEDVQRIAVDLFRDEGLVATVVGPRAATPYPAERLRIQRS